MRTGARSGERRWPLDELRRAVLTARTLRRAYPAPAAREYVLSLAFGRKRRAVISSRGFAGFGAPQDLAPAFAAFCAPLLAAAAAASPDARFLRGPSSLTSAIGLAILLLGLGALVTLAFALSSGTGALGIDLAARLVFTLLLLACAWPWLTDERRRAFDPLAAGSELPSA